MALLGLILIFVLQFEGISGKDIQIYSRPGDEVILPCNRNCFQVDWLYNRRNPSPTSLEARNGNVNEKSARAARLRLNTDCSLVINNTVAEDAGRYTCRQGLEVDIEVHLNIMTISPSPPDDPNRDGKVTLQCSLLTFINSSCRLIRLRWVDETGAELLGEGVGYKLIRQANCVSGLIVMRQSGHNRKYTCQLVDQSNKVQIEAEYTPVFTGLSLDQIYTIVGAVVGAVVVLTVITAVLIRFRKRDTVTEDAQKNVSPPDQDEPEGGLTYVTLNHASQKTTSKKRVREEAVTYSTVKAPVTKQADKHPSRSYSNVR